MALINMACIDLTDRFELHYAANVVSNLRWVFFLFLVSFFWQPVVQTSKLFSVLIKLTCHCYGRGSGEAAYVHCRAALTSQSVLWNILKRQRLSCVALPCTAGASCCVRGSCGHFWSQYVYGIPLGWKRLLRYSWGGTDSTGSTDVIY